MEVPTTPQFEEASKCPKCHEPGEPSGMKPARDGTANRGTAFVFKCLNERCRWFKSGWVVQVLPDGTIPINKPGPKKYETSDWAKALGQQYIEQTLGQEGKELPSIG